MWSFEFLEFSLHWQYVMELMIYWLSNIIHILCKNIHTYNIHRTFGIARDYCCQYFTMYNPPPSFMSTLHGEWREGLCCHCTLHVTITNACKKDNAKWPRICSLLKKHHRISWCKLHKRESCFLFQNLGKILLKIRKLTFS